MDNDLYEKTRQLLTQLNHFIIHVVIYFFVNLALVLAAFSDLGTRWWIFFFVISWAIGLIYHGFRVYGVDLLSKKNKKANLLFSWLLKFSST